MRRWPVVAVVWLLILGAFCYSAEISPSVESWVRSAGENDRLVAWVFLRDKGNLGDELVEAKLREVARSFAPKAVQRRLRARP
jgi:endonuclease YncB( thermonuclease family)